MTRELLFVDVCETLYGARWKSDAALFLDVTRRTVTLWSKKAPKDTHPVWAKLDTLLAARAKHLERQQKKLRRVLH